MYKRYFVVFFRQLKIQDIFGSESMINIFAACRTTKNANSPSKNVPCVFPFNFKTKDNYKCIWDKTGPWCSTKIDKFGKHVGGNRGFWGYCNPQCPTYDKHKGSFKDNFSF